MNRSLLLEVLSRIPEDPGKIDTTTLFERLTSAGLGINLRLLQRLLVSLERDGVLQRVGKGKPHQWSWPKEQYFEFPKMTAEAALSMVMAYENVQSLLPPSAVADLKARARRASQVLATSTAYKDWKPKVRVLPRGLATIPPAVAPDVLRTVYQALFEGRQLTAEYRMHGKDDYKRFDVNPLGIVVRNGVISLVSTKSGTTHMQQLQLHRMRNPQLTPDRARIPAGFSLDEHVKAGNVSFKLSPEPIELELLVTQVVVNTLTETKLSKGQTIETADGGRHRVRATVPDTIELRGWIKSYGAHIEVVAPENVRREIAQELREAANRYT
jgi:predicted DNA-binding transcriptional regulator YafY